MKCLVLLLCSALSLQATIYYVDPVNGDDSHPGTSAALAWQHLPLTCSDDTGTNFLNGDGWQPMSLGDIVYVMGGTTNYSRVQIDSSWYGGNTAFNSILIQSGHLKTPQWGTTPAIFDGGNTNTAIFALTGTLGDGPLLGITLDGFEIRNVKCGAAGLGFDTSKGSSGILAGSSVYPVHYLTIQRCWIHDCLRTDPTATYDDMGHGIEFNGRCTNFIVRWNTFGTNIGTKGIETYRAAYGAISNNLFQGPIGDHSIALSDSTNVDVCNNLIWMVPPQVHEPTYGIQIATSEKCDVWNNIVYRTPPVDNSTAYLRGAMGIGCYNHGLSNRVVHNVIAFFGDSLNDGTSTAIRLYDNNGSTDVGFIFQNNIVWECWNYSKAAYFVQTDYASGEKVRYNDFYCSSNTAVMSYRTSPGDVISNTVAAFALNASATSTYSNNVQLDPVFVKGIFPTSLDGNYHPNTNSFKLTKTTPSAVRVTGNTISGDAYHGWDTAAGKFSRDIVGVSRINWSMGAYEQFVSSITVTNKGKIKNAKIRR